MFASCSSHYDEIDEVVDQSVILTKSANGTSTSIDVIYDVDLKLLKKYLRLSGKDKKQHSIQPLQLDGSILAYCIQYEEGWEIISADKRCAPVMISSEMGVCNVEDFDVQGVLEHINNVRKNNSENIIPTWEIIQSNGKHSNMRALTRGGGSEESFTIGMWRVIDTVLVEEVEEIPHIIKANWDQGEPWNNCMRYIGMDMHAELGSLTVAAGQIIHHYRKTNPMSLGFPIEAYPSTVRTGFNTDLNPHEVDATRWPLMALNENDQDTASVAIMLTYLEQEIMGLGVDPDNNSYNIDGNNCPFSWGNLLYDRYNRYNFDEIYSSLLIGSPVCVCASLSLNTTKSMHAYIIDRYKKTDTYYAITCRWDPDYIVSEDEYYSNDPEMFIESASSDEKVFTKGLCTYTYWGMNWGLSDIGSNYDDRFYMSRSYDAGGMDDAGYIPPTDYISSPYWDMSLGRTSTVHRIYTNFRNR